MHNQKSPTVHAAGDPRIAGLAMRNGVEMILPSDEAAWIAARGQDITASVAAGLLGIHPYSTPYQLWAEKTGRIARSIAETKALRRGKLLEPVAVEVLREERPDWRIDYRNDRAYFRDPLARVGATPDVFAERPDRDGRGVVQIKTVSHEAYVREWQDPDTGDAVPPLWIAVQTIMEAKLTGSSWACIGALIWNRDALDLHLIEIPIKDAIYRRVVQKTAEFWELVASGEEPDPDWNRDGRAVLSVYADSVANRVDLSDLEGIDAVLERYEELGRIERAAKRERDTLKPQIIFTLGNSEAGHTAAWDIAAPTVRKDAHLVKGAQYRGLRIKPRRNRRG